MLQEFNKAMYFYGYTMEANGSNYYANASMFLNDKYETYTLHNIIFEWDDEKINYEINKTINFVYDDWRCKIYSEEEFKKYIGISKPEIRTWYIMEYLDGFPVINFAKIFKGKQIGNVFTCKVTINFSFDNEPQITLSYYNDIFVDKNNYFGIIDKMFYF